MTRDEIAKWLENLKDDIGKSENQPLWHYAEALDIAIEALQTDIVRCGECEHKADNYCYKHSHEVTDSDFCSYGERRD